jgi:capsule polysaccharide export protein KpsE/RkpR
VSNSPIHDSHDGQASSTPADRSPFEVAGAGLYRRRKLLAAGWAVFLALSLVVALLSKKHYTSETTVQINPEIEMGLGGLAAEGLKMLDAGSGTSQGLGTVLAIMDSRKFAMTMINDFGLKNVYKTKWDHMAIKAFRKNFTYQAFDEGIVSLSFTYPHKDSCKVILDSILGYINAKTIEFATSKARQEFAFNQRQVDSVYRRIDSIQLEAIAYLRRNNIVDVESNMEVVLLGYGQIQNAIMQLESQYAIAKIDNRVPPQEKQNLRAQLEALKQKRRELFADPGHGKSGSKRDYDLSVSYDSMPALAAWQERMKLMAARDEAILKILIPKLEHSRLKMVETTPVINVIDPSFVPPYKSGPKRAFIVLGITFGLGIVFTFLVLLFDLFRNPAIDPGGVKRFLRHVRAAG